VSIDLRRLSGISCFNLSFGVLLSRFTSFDATNIPAVSAARIPQFAIRNFSAYQSRITFHAALVCPFLRTNPRYGGDDNHGADSSGGCFLLHRRHLASAERATEHISFRVTVTVSIGCAFTDADSPDAP
jgi:hypothetical protein